MTDDTPTDRSTVEPRTSTGRSMEAVDHTHPGRNTTFGSIFGRGPSVAADGGKPATAPDPDEDEIMGDVDHEAPSDSGANATFERGAEHAGAAEDDEDVGAGEVTDE